ncbi:LacI family DNA-binding transcriptional regulator [Paraglaciecola aquimarina]|uniref:LacI family DNA-binding transcriptional regulator n=1 Tax=Paraglaciecola aquimarina TaxID=1235557 RepID=A0ABU3SVQ6_9ALTE|nr:LacI family DNA-binding transcriptional regulator [Paraglaciecola aquimarina]MDU0354071.1 LacI family DNA-binding transcriptional regulator [Paraglaciecola aquimarina]
MKQSKRAGIKDVAELAGVSNMTVSRVLNGTVKVSEEKRKAVLTAVEKLDYKPDLAARRLGGNKSYMLGLLYQDLDISYVSKFLLNALKSSRDQGFHLIPNEIDGDIEKSLSSVVDLIEITRIDGLILLPPVSDNQQIIDVLKKHQTPFVRITPDSHFDLSPYICIDDYMVGYKMTEHLINLGHKKVAHIMGNTKQGTSHLRCQGFVDALHTNHLSAPEEFIVEGTYTFDSGVEAAKKLLNLANRPSAIFASNDEMAAAVILVANNLGIAIPEQLSVAGVDDAQLAVTLSPNLTTIKQPIAQMAELAVKLLAKGADNLKMKERISTAIS